MTLSITFYDGIQYHRGDFLSRDSDFFGNGIVVITEFPAAVPATPNMSFTIGQGRAWVDGYRIVNDASPVSLSVSAADPANPRIDIVQIGHDDINSTYSLVVKKGVAAASPVEPGADPGYIKLWAINVPANATSIPLGNFIDRRALVPLNVSGTQITFTGSAGTGEANTFAAGFTQTFAGPVALQSAVSLATGKTFTNNGTITGGTINASSVPWSGVIGTPTSLVDYGITTPIVPNQAAGDNSTKAANTAYVDANINVAPINTSALVHGLQALTTSQASLAVPTVNGRTLANIIGKDGNCESLAGWTTGGNVLPVVSTTQFKSGSSSIKCAPTSGSYAYRSYTYSLDTTKQYIAACWVYLESWTTGTPVLRLSDTSGTVRYTANVNTSIIGSWQLVYVKVPTSNTIVGTGFRLFFGTSGTDTYVVYFDDIRIYELSATDSTAIGTTYTTDAQIDGFIPYVDSVKHVLYPSITKYGKNLLPDFTQWAVNANAVVTLPYSLTLTAPSTTVQNSTSPNIYLIPSTQYVFSFSLTGNAQVVYAEFDASGNVITGNTPISSGGTITTKSNHSYLYFQFRNNAVTGTFTFTNPQLELGSVATAFEVQNNDYLYGVTDSLGNPVKLGSDVSRTVYDSMTYRDGNWWLTKRWMKDVPLLGSLVWAFSTDFTGYKSIYTTSYTHPNGYTTLAAIAKYDASILQKDTAITAAAMTGANKYILGSGSTVISLSDTDTGFDHAYIPIATEISAYFYGWKVNGYTAGTTITNEASGSIAAAGTYTLLHAGKYKSVSITKSTDNITFVAAVEGTDYTVNFNGTAVFTNNTAGSLYYQITYTYGVAANSWVSVVDGTTAPTTNTIAFVSANQAVGYTPYSLSYQLAVSTEEIVNVEGSIGLHSGGNQIEVLEGVIDREVCAPALTGGIYYINTTTLPTSNFAFRALKVIAVYKNGVKDSKWIIETIASAYGTQRAKILQADYDPTAVYTVTYIVLDKYLLSSNLASVSIDYQANIAGAVSKNVKEIADLKTEVSVIEKLKANLASPALTGVPTAPTPAGADNSTTIATTAFVRSAITTYAPTPAAATTSVLGTVEIAAAPAAGSPIVSTRVGNIIESLLTATTITSVLSYTPLAAGNFLIYVSARVVTAATNITVEVDYTDAGGAQVNMLYPLASVPIGTHMLNFPLFISAVAGSAITVKVTAGTANQVYISSSIVGV